MEKVEGVEDELVAGAFGERLLEQGEAGDALVVQDDDLAVDDRLAARQPLEGVLQVAITLRPVQPAARDQLDLAVGDMGGGAVAVELYLVQPALLIPGRGVRRGGELRRDA